MSFKEAAVLNSLNVRKLKSTSTKKPIKEIEEIN